MMLDIPAVVDTAGTNTSLQYSSTGVYAYTGPVRIPGRFISAIADNDQVDQNGTGQTGLAFGAQSTGKYLALDSFGSGGASSPTEDWVDVTNGTGLFTPSGKPYLPPNLFIRVSPLAPASIMVMAQNNQNYVFSDGNLTTPYGRITLSDEMRKHVRPGSGMKYLFTTTPSFTIPGWARSFMLRNRSGADMYFRRFAPNADGHVIDTPTAFFTSDPVIVGMLIKDGETSGFINADFTNGGSYIICADVAAPAGALVDFYP